MKLEIKKTLTLINSITLSIIGYLTFIVSDWEKVTIEINKNQMIHYILNNFNYIIASLLIGLAFYFVQFVLDKRLKKGLEDISQKFVLENSNKIENARSVNAILNNNETINQRLIREVLLPTISEKNLYELLEYNVFENKKFNIDDLANFGIEQKYIDKLRKKFHEIESKKIS